MNIEPKGPPIYTHTLGLESIQEFYPVKLKPRHLKYMKTAPRNIPTTSDFPKYDIQYALNGRGMHHVGHTSHFNKPHKFQDFILQSKKAYINLELETKTNCSEPVRHDVS